MAKFDIVDQSENDPENWSNVREKKEPTDERKAVRGFLILVLMVWLVYFSIIAMIHLAGVLL